MGEPRAFPAGHFPPRASTVKWKVWPRKTVIPFEQTPALLHLVFSHVGGSAKGSLELESSIKEAALPLGVKEDTIRANSSLRLMHRRFRSFLPVFGRWK